MAEHARECLERAKYCTRLAEAESDPELKAYLLELAVDWTRAAQHELAGAYSGKRDRARAAVRSGGAQNVIAFSTSPADYPALSRTAARFAFHLLGVYLIILRSISPH